MVPVLSRSHPKTGSFSTRERQKVSVLKGTVLSEVPTAEAQRKLWNINLASIHLRLTTYINLFSQCKGIIQMTGRRQDESGFSLGARLSTAAAVRCFRLYQPTDGAVALQLPCLWHFKSADKNGELEHHQIIKFTDKSTLTSKNAVFMQLRHWIT